MVRGTSARGVSLTMPTFWGLPKSRRSQGLLSGCVCAQEPPLKKCVLAFALPVPLSRSMALPAAPVVIDPSTGFISDDTEESAGVALVAMFG